eukprot:5602469-Pleurochrysis_carterae.AAC.3
METHIKPAAFPVKIHSEIKSVTVYKFLVIASTQTRKRCGLRRRSLEEPLEVLDDLAGAQCTRALGSNILVMCVAHILSDANELVSLGNYPFGAWLRHTLSGKQLCFSSLALHFRREHARTSLTTQRSTPLTT